MLYQLNQHKLSLFNTILLLMVIMGTNSCTKSDPTDCFKSTGAETTVTRSTGIFDKIILNDNVNLVLTQSSSQSISIKGGKNLLKKVKTDINDGALNIENQNSCNWMRSFDKEITVYVNVNQLHEIEYNGSGDISCTNTIISDSLKLNVWEGAGNVDIKVETERNFIYFHIGTADINYSGVCHLSYVTLSSFGPIKAENLQSAFTYIANNGSNNCYIQANTRIEANIGGLGDIYYRGDPEIIINKTGEGNMIKMD